MNASIRLHLISGAGQHGSTVVFHNDPDSLTPAVEWLMARAASLHVNPTLVVIHGEATTVLTTPMDLPTTEELVEAISTAWAREEA